MKSPLYGNMFTFGEEIPKTFPSTVLQLLQVMSRKWGSRRGKMQVKSPGGVEIQPFINLMQNSKQIPYKFEVQFCHSYAEFTTEEWGK